MGEHMIDIKQALAQYEIISDSEMEEEHQFDRDQRNKGNCLLFETL